MRRSSLSLLVPATLLAAVAAGVPAAQAHNGSGSHQRHGHAQRFEADLGALNVDGRGRAKLRERNGELVVKLRARGLDDGIHVAHIHGIRQAENECPDHSFDTDNNGFVDLLEGLPAYGPVQITLSNGLNDTGTQIKYKRTYTVLDSGDALSALGDLSQYAIVVHGVDLNGDHVANNPNAGGDAANDQDDNEISMPALCGVIERD
jgi:Cu/Zn superoxide dismutase